MSSTSVVTIVSAMLNIFSDTGGRGVGGGGERERAVLRETIPQKTLCENLFICANGGLVNMLIAGVRVSHR